MTQDPARIRATLAVLREQLADSEEVSPELRTSLLETVTNFEQALAELDAAKAPAAKPAATPSSDSLASRLSEAALEFEESHPTLAKTIGGLVNGLANLGI